jgi:adenylate cyclase
VLFFAFVLPAVAPDSAPAKQMPFIVGFSIGYLTVGLASLALARPGRFRVWMTWLFTTLDLCIWATLMVSVVVNVGLPANYFVAAPPSVVTFIILALVTLRNDPWLQAFSLAFIVVVLIALFVLAPGRDADPREVGDAVASLFHLPQSIMRLAILVVTGLALVSVAVRTRRLIHRAVAETLQRRALTRYLPPQLADHMAEIDDQKLLKGTLQQAAVLFVDIRGFTALAEGMDPTALSNLLAEYRGIVSAEVHAHNGIVDKFVGDSVMAVFGVAQGSSNAAADAVESARGIVAAIGDWNAKRGRNGLDTVSVGVGAHWGEVFCGAIGDRDRLEFTVLGDTVNIAARLESVTKEAEHPIVVSEALLDAAGGPGDRENAGWLPLREISIRGRRGSIRAYARG